MSGLQLKSFLYIYLSGKQECIHDSCCQTYPGERAFSESESSNVAAYLRTRGSELKAFFDLHSYSQMWLSPWGHRKERPPDYYKMVNRQPSSARYF